MASIFNHLFSGPQKPDLSLRRKIALDTIARSNAITQEHVDDGATEDSTFIGAQLPALDPSACPNLPPCEVQVVNSDSFTAARNIIATHPESMGGISTAVLNLASDQTRAGGWEHSLSTTQEEALCYSSTLYSTLKSTYYPWPNLGPGSIAGVYSPGIVIFKDDLDHGCAPLRPRGRRVVAVITVAAPRLPKLTEDQLHFKNPSDLDDLRGKIRLVYRMAAHHNQRFLVLGAMGCGAYQCPPQLVAEEMKAALLEIEFKGWFEQVVFAIYSRKENGPGNFGVFKEVFQGVKV